MTSTYLISCSGTKACLCDHDVKSSSLSNISGFQELNGAREQLIRSLGVQLDFEKCLPAWQLYRGRLYMQIDAENWSNSSNKIIIMSALFGLIFHDDYIPKYDFSMSNRICKDFWKSQNLESYLVNYNIVNLTFKNYHESIFPNREVDFKRPKIIWKDKYGFHRGRWLNEQLNVNKL